MKKRDKSIIQNDLTKCYVCGRPREAIHEVFYGTANRKKSIEYGCYIALCGEHHNLSNKGIHFDKALDNYVKAETQAEFEKIYGHEKFIKTFGKSYL